MTRARAERRAWRARASQLGLAYAHPSAYTLRMDSRRGVEVGMLVRDAEGRELGKVRRCYPWGFEVARGFLSRRQWVIRYDEVLEVSRGVARVARSPDALFQLAAGGLPSTWRRVTPPFAPEPLPSAPAVGDVEGALVSTLVESAEVRTPVPEPTESLRLRRAAELAATAESAAAQGAG